MVSLPTTGLIAGSALGWEGVFYLHGGLAVVWCFLWVAFVTDSPSDHRFISNEERELIESSTNAGSSAKKGPTPPVPWGKIFTSVPFWYGTIQLLC